MADRWLEVDIDWFGMPDWHDRIATFANRVAPLLTPASDHRGVILNVGWLVDIVTEFTGDLDQPLPLRARRYAGLATLSYRDLAGFVNQLKDGFAAVDVPGVKVGVLVAAPGQVVYPPDTGVMYDLYSNWHDRHPELYYLDLSRLPGPDLDPRVPLTSDDYPYAAFPTGLAGGERFGDVLGAQWGAVSRAVGLDCLHLRDGFITPMLYTRKGPYGVIQHQDPAVNAEWTEAVTGLIRACKRGNPDALVMAYSSGISGTAEWFSGCVDVEEVLAESELDIWIDQTWGGAWQDWWDDHWKGWTFQHTNLLVHQAMVHGANARRDRPCRQYNLIETFDGWEPWDTIHRTPGKLAWATWAFTHAATVGPDGRLMVPEGSYLSWMSDWDLVLLSVDDVAFLSSHLDAAESSADRLEEIYGPLLIHDRASLRALADKAPDTNASQWLEDHAALAMKFGLPVLAATRLEWLAGDHPEGLLMQLPKVVEPDRIDRLDDQTGPVAVVGRADHLDERLLDRTGVVAVGESRPAGFRRDQPVEPDLPAGDSVHLPDHRHVEVAADAEILYGATGTPLAVRTGRWHYWQPPDLADPADPLLPTSQLGTVSSYVEIARSFNRLAGDAGGIEVAPVDVAAPVTVQAWRSGGVVHLLVGNLENGWIGDARTPRAVTVTVPRQRIGATGDGWAPVVIDGAAEARVESGDDALTCHIRVGPRGFAVVQLRQEDVA